MSLRHVMSRMSWRDAKDAAASSSSPASWEKRRVPAADSPRRAAGKEPVRALMFLSFWGPNT